ncbi:hypothetical protein [Kitasatospora sp. NPDC051914]|uniref:hypothetical protein n=1 Tax=Kitasatospora sp. NPDC051914 TaxID=3154945 RepID=UPI00343B0BCC
MRAIHAARPRPEQAGSRHRAGKLAAGSAILVQLWGFGLGICDARAAEGPGPGLTDQVDAPALLHRLGGDTVPAVHQQTAPVAEVLRDRIRVDGLPLPGQAATVPDAFAIAAVLLPAVPPRPREDGGGVSGPPPAAPGEAVAAEPGTDGGSAARAPAPVPWPPAAAVPAIRADQPAEEPARVPGPAAGRPVPEHGTAPAADPFGAAPTVRARADDAVAVLVPIAAGLLLTGLAMYKHRGLPSGH